MAALACQADWPELAETVQQAHDGPKGRSDRLSVYAISEGGPDRSRRRKTMFGQRLSADETPGRQSCHLAGHCSNKMLACSERKEQGRHAETEAKQVVRLEGEQKPT
jgi:hypothetical protein